MAGVGGRGLGGQGTSLGAQPAASAGVGGAVALHSSPAPPGGPLLPASPVLPPRTHATWRGLWRGADQPGSSAGSVLLFYMKCLGNENL